MVQKTNVEGGSDDPWPVLLDRSRSGLFDRKVLSSPITSLGLVGLYLGHGHYVWNYESIQSYIRIRFPFPRLCVGNWSWNISWM